MSLNQDYALKVFREDRYREYPELYSVGERDKDGFVMMFLKPGTSEEPEWYRVMVVNGGVREVYYPPFPGWNMVKYLSSGQKRKIIQVLGAGA